MDPIPESCSNKPLPIYLDNVAKQAHAAVCDKPGVVHFLERGVGLGEIYGILEFMPEGYKAMWHADATLVSVTDPRRNLKLGD